MEIEDTLFRLYMCHSLYSSVSLCGCDYTFMCTGWNLNVE